MCGENWPGEGISIPVHSGEPLLGSVGGTQTGRSDCRAILRSWLRPLPAWEPGLPIMPRGDVAALWLHRESSLAFCLLRACWLRGREGGREVSSWGCCWSRGSTFTLAPQCTSAHQPRAFQTWVLSRSCGRTTKGGCSPLPSLLPSPLPAQQFFFKKK